MRPPRAAAGSHKLILTEEAAPLHMLVLCLHPLHPAPSSRVGKLGELGGHEQAKDLTWFL